MVRIGKFLKPFSLLQGFLFLSMMYSCEDQSSAEEIVNDSEVQVVETSKEVLKAKVEDQPLKWCVFGNYCDSTGRHYPAKFLVNIWKYSDGEKQEQLYTDLSNEVELNEDGDFAGTTLCMDLENSPETDEYYVEIRLLNSDAYDELSETIIREGVIDENEIINLYVGEDSVDYFHFREGCDSSDTPDLLSL